MARLTPLAQEIALCAVFGPGTTIGLLRGGEEIEDAGYLRQALGPPAFSDSDQGFRVLTNQADMRFGPWGEAASAPVDGWAAFRADGELMAVGEIRTRNERDRQPPQGHELVIMAGKLELVNG